MNSFTYTPADETVEAGLAYANAIAKAAHDAAQLLLPEADRQSYTITEAEYAKAALDRVGARYYDQMLQERVASEENKAFALAIAANLENPTVAVKFAELQQAVAAAEA